jgi:VWFA-related protein
LEIYHDLVKPFTSSGRASGRPGRYTADMATFLRILLLAAVACTATPLGLTADLSAQQRALRDQTIFISVQDKQGKPPATLALTDLAIREDGNVREILKVEPATTPLQIAVLVDTSQAAQASIADLRDAVKAFAAAIWAKSPETQIALYTFGERPTLATDYTTSAVALGRGVDTMFAASGSGAYFIDAVIESAQALAKRKPARGAIVAFVDENGPEFSNRRHQQAFDAVAAARASLWTIARQGFSNDSMSTESRERGTIIGDVTTRTGGRSSMIFAPSALKERFTDVAAQLLGQFAVTYARPESLIPPERLEVRLSREGFRLHAPRWTNK